MLCYIYVISMLYSVCLFVCFRCCMCKDLLCALSLWLSVCLTCTSDLYVCLSGPLTSSLSLTPVQSAAWSEQQQQQQGRREQISKKPLERSSVISFI